LIGMPMEKAKFYAFKLFKVKQFLSIIIIASKCMVLYTYIQEQKSKVMTSK
jgi:hypothetical protein